MASYIKDLEGSLIEVTDLKAAILQVAMYLGFLFEAENPSQKAFVEKRQKYWKDLYGKLNRLREIKEIEYEKD